MTSFDEHANLAFGTVSAGSGVIGSTTGTTIVAKSEAEAAEFPSVPFYVTVWRDLAPERPAVEIMRVTAFDGHKTFTVEREQQGTTAQSSITQNWRFGNTITVADIAAIEDAVNDEETARASADAGLQAQVTGEVAARIAGDAATLASAESYADSGDAGTRAYADAGDATTLALAEAYAIARSVVMARGDLIVGAGVGGVGRVPVGADGLSLIADSSQSFGLRYGAPSALSSVGDATITSDSDGSGTGDIVLLSGTTEQLRATAAGVLERKNSLLVHQDGHDSADIVPGTVILKWDGYGNLFAGPNVYPLDAQDRPLISDFFYSQAYRRVFARTLILRELGDPPDFVIGRAGPDNTWPDNGGLGVSGVTVGTNLGTFRFQGAYTPIGGTPGVTLGGGWQGTSAQIYSRATENNMQTLGGFAQGGELRFATTPNGTDTPVDGLVVTHDQKVLANDLSVGVLGGSAVANWDVDTTGRHAWSDGTSAADIAVSRSAASALKFTLGGLWIPAGVITFAKAGPVSDGDFAAGLRQNGMVGVDTSGKQIYLRTGAAEWTAIGASALAGAGLVANGTTIDVNADGSTLEVATDVLQIKDLGVSAAKLAASAVTNAKIAASAVTTAKIADASVTSPKLSLTAGQTHISGDVTMTNADTYYDGPSLVLAAGTWLLSGDVFVFDPSSSTAVVWTAKLWDGTTVYDSRQANKRPAGGEGLSLHVGAIITLAVPTTVKISVAASGASTLIKATIVNNSGGTTNTASGLLAVRIG